VTSDEGIPDRRVLTAMRCESFRLDGDKRGTYNCQVISMEKIRVNVQLGESCILAESGLSVGGTLYKRVNERGRGTGNMSYR
jgi:hypothetical protein